MKILAIVVLYNPDTTLLQKNLSAFYLHVDKVLLWNNNSTEESMENIKRMAEKQEKILLVQRNKNEGIAAALNYGWEYARNNGYTAILSMDQDSVFHHFEIFKRRVSEKWTQEGLCLCGPICTPKAAVPTKDSFIRKNHIITSGMLVPVALLNQVDGYCSDFFVDGIDIDLCVKARQYHYQSLIYEGAYLTQIYGIPQSKKVLGKTLHSPGYPPHRLYEIFRNHIIIYRRYHYPSDILIHILYLYVLGFVFKGVLLIEEHKKDKLMAVWQGIKDGCNAKL